MNHILFISLFAIIFTQMIKYPIAYLMNRKHVNLSIMTSTGGMPSSHSAAVSSLICSLILEYGFNSPLVAIATIFGVIIMFDSMGVRRQSGEQGLVIDELIHLLNQSNEHHSARTTDTNSKHSSVISDQDLSRYNRMVIKRYLGHKPSEVIVGVITGMLIAIIFQMLIF